MSGKGAWECEEGIATPPSWVPKRSPTGALEGKETPGGRAWGVEESLGANRGASTGGDTAVQADVVPALAPSPVCGAVPAGGSFTGGVVAGPAP
jgi:hypothetical protein